MFFEDYTTVRGQSYGVLSTENIEDLLTWLILWRIWSKVALLPLHWRPAFSTEVYSMMFYAASEGLESQILLCGWFAAEVFVYTRGAWSDSSYCTSCWGVGFWCSSFMSSISCIFLFFHHSTFCWGCFVSFPFPFLMLTFPRVCFGLGSLSSIYLLLNF